MKESGNFLLINFLASASSGSRLSFILVLFHYAQKFLPLVAGIFDSGAKEERRVGAGRALFFVLLRSL